jgi:hypothetical protein
LGDGELKDAEAGVLAEFAVFPDFDEGGGMIRVEFIPFSFR